MRGSAARMVFLEIQNRYQIRGGEDVARDAEVGMLRDRGHRVVEHVESSDAVASLGLLRTSCRTIWSVSSYRRIRELIREEKPDVAIVHNFFPLVSPSVFHACQREKVPVILVVHNYRLFCPAAILFRAGQVCERCMGRWFAWPGVLLGCYRSSRIASLVVATMVAVHRCLGTWRRVVMHYIAVSEFARRKCIEGGIHEGKVTVRPNFVSPDPGEGMGTGGFIFFAGRMPPEKGLRILVEAWREAGRPAPLKIAGDGSEGTLLRQATLGETGIEWLGVLTPEQTRDWMGKAAVLAVPSLWGETFGLVVAEAYARGTPVLVSDMGALPELVEEGVTGFRVPAGDVGAWASALRRFFALSGTVRAGMRRAARRAFEERYQMDRNYELLMGVVHKILDDERGRV